MNNKNIIKIIIFIFIMLTLIFLTISILHKEEPEIIEPEEPEIINGYTSEDLKNNENEFLNNTIDIENNTTQNTDIPQEIIDQGLIPEELIEIPLLPVDFEIKPSINPTTKTNSELNNYTQKIYTENDLINVWGIDFYLDPQINTKTKETSILLMTHSLHFENDANELKEDIINLINNFTTENSNIIFKRNVHIKNIYDIPSYGVRILSEDEKNFHYLFITTPHNQYKYVNIEYYIVSKEVEQIKSQNQKTAMIIADIQNMLSLSTSSYKFKISEDYGDGIYTSLNVNINPENFSEETKSMISIYGKIEPEEPEIKEVIIENEIIEEKTQDEILNEETSEIEEIVSETTN